MKRKTETSTKTTAKTETEAKSTSDPLDHLRSVDPKLAKVIDKVGPYAISKQKTKTTFEALARSIVYQQLSGKAAATIFGRLVATLGGKLTPEGIANASDKQLRAAGLSGSKAKSLRDLAEKTANGTLPTLARLRRMENEAIIEALTQVRGIGRWSVEMLLMFRLERGDILPVSDYGIRKGFMRVYGRSELPTLAELAEHGERWAPHRTVASWYLWRSLDQEAAAPPAGKRERVAKKK